MKNLPTIPIGSSVLALLIIVLMLAFAWVKVAPAFEAVAAFAAFENEAVDAAVEGRWELVTTIEDPQGDSLTFVKIR